MKYEELFNENRTLRAALAKIVTENSCSECSAWTIADDALGKVIGPYRLRTEYFHNGLFTRVWWSDGAIEDIQDIELGQKAL